MGVLGRTLLTPEIRIFIFSPGDNGISQLKTTFLQPNDGVMISYYSFACSFGSSNWSALLAVGSGFGGFTWKGFCF